MSRIRESELNASGLTRYVDDLPLPAQALFAAIVPTPCAHGRLRALDISRALAVHPSVRVFSAADVPGENQLGEAVADEPLLVADEWSYMGQPLAIVVAVDRSTAREAARLVKVDFEELSPITDAREAAASGLFILPSRTMRAGDPETAFARCAIVVDGRVESSGQEHVYLETQSAIAEQRDGGGFRVVSSTQSPSGVQHAVARVLGLAMSDIEVEAPRLGGGFGGKEDQATLWAALAALGAYRTSRVVKLVLGRREDMRWTGKRHPYSSDFRIGLDAAGHILAFEADYYQNSGACCDLSPAILSRTLFHAASAYRIPNLRVTGYMCRTNLPPFTAFRGFGAPQGIFVIEAAIDAAAERGGWDRMELRRRNLLAEGDTFHFGQAVDDCRATRAFDRLLAKSRWSSLRSEIDSFNASHALEKRGAAILPLCFGVSFTKLMMNQGGALVHVYHDGSVSVSTGAVEMGQQVARKIQVVAARALGLPEDLVKVVATRTGSVANTFPTAASTGSDINGMAALAACEEIRGRLLDFAARKLGADKTELRIESGVVLRGGAAAGLPWAELVEAAHAERIDLSAHGFYATPGLFYDAKAERGSPFAYHVYGCAAVSAVLDVLRGTYRIDSATIVHDGGESIDRSVDLGQIEGAFAQGAGWSVLEDLRYDEKGSLLSDTLSTYKLPDVGFLPDVDVEFLENAGNPKAVLHSKAIGEPPFMYGIAAYFAVLDALRAARPDLPAFYNLPMTPEKALMHIAKERA
jgi:xanthine dehydrogenase large subunit